jgi:hypothetical protein
MKLYKDHDIGKMKCFIHTKKLREDEDNEETYKCCGKKKWERGCHKSDHIYTELENRDMLIKPYSLLFEKDIDLEWFLKEDIDIKDQIIIRISSEQELNKKFKFLIPDNKSIFIDLKEEYKYLKEKLNSKNTVPDIKEKTAYTLYHTYDNENEQDTLKLCNTFIPFYIIRRISHIKNIE